MNWLQRVVPALRDDEPVLEYSDPTWSIGDPAFAGFVQTSIASLSGISEIVALRQPAFWRAVTLIAGVIAAMPLKAYRMNDLDEREQVGSFLDNSLALGLTKFNWLEMVTAHLLMMGEIGLVHLKNNAGSLIGLLPVHRGNYEVRWNGTQKEFKVTIGSKTEDYTSDDFTQLMGLTVTGLRGVSPLTLFQKSIQLAEAEQRAATNTMVKGFLIAALASPENEDITKEEAQTIQKGLSERMEGADNAGGLRIVNRRFKVTPMQANARDMQFLEGREFSVHEVSRMFGVPAHLLASTTKEQSFASGLAEQVAGLQKFTLMPWTSRIEEALSALLPSNRFCEFDFSGLLAGTPGEEINLLLAQIAGQLLTPNEARKIRNLPPLPDGDKLLTAPPPAPVQDKPIPGSGTAKAFSTDVHLHVDKGAIQNHTHIVGKDKS